MWMYDRCAGVIVLAYVRLESVSQLCVKCNCDPNHIKTVIEREPNPKNEIVRHVGSKIGLLREKAGI